MRVGVTLDDLARALRFILQTPSFTGDTLIVDSGEHLSGRPRDALLDPAGEGVTWNAASSSATFAASLDRHPRFREGGPQTVVVNVDLLLAPDDKAHNDRIANVLNYDTVHDGITRLAGSRHFNLQEALVDAILDLCLAQPGVIEARVSTESPTSTRIAASATRPCDAADAQSRSHAGRLPGDDLCRRKRAPMCPSARSCWRIST